MRISVLNGPNLNLLGEREPDVYGAESLADIEAWLVVLADELGATLSFHQRNGEGDLIDLVHAARDGDGLVINPGAYAHTSVALRDAIAGIYVPCIEIHISNVYARESFRHTSLLSPVVDGYIAGCGTFGYELALRACIRRIVERRA